MAAHVFWPRAQARGTRAGSSLSLDCAVFFNLGTRTQRALRPKPLRRGWRLSKEMNMNMKSATAEEESLLLPTLNEPIDGTTVQRLREDLGLTQKAFAEFLRVPHGTVATWERRGTLSSTAAIVIRTAEKKTAKVRIDRKRVLAEGI